MNSSSSSVSFWPSHTIAIIAWAFLGVFILILLMLLCARIGYHFATILMQLDKMPACYYQNYPFQPGDLLLFSASVESYSHFSEFCQMILFGSPITHVGIVVCDQVTNVFYCAELQIGCHPNMIRFSNLWNRIESYPGTILVRPLEEIISSSSSSFTAAVPHLSQSARIQLFHTAVETTAQHDFAYDLLFFIRNPTNFYYGRRQKDYYQHQHQQMKKKEATKKIATPLSECNRIRTDLRLRDYIDTLCSLIKDHCSSNQQSSEEAEDDAIMMTKFGICTDFVMEIYYHAGVIFQPKERKYPYEFFSHKESIPIHNKKWRFGPEIRLLKQQEQEQEQEKTTKEIVQV
jgi:hypothetical protein